MVSVSVFSAITEMMKYSNASDIIILQTRNCKDVLSVGM